MTEQLRVFIDGKGTDLYQALKAEGFDLPDECRDLRLTMPVEGVFVLHYEVNVYGERLAKVGRALACLGITQESWQKK